MTPKSVASISHLMSFLLKHCSVDISSIFQRLMLSLWFFFKTLILTSSREKWSLRVWVLLSAVFCPFSLSLRFEKISSEELVKRRISIKSNAECAFLVTFLLLGHFSSVPVISTASSSPSPPFQNEMFSKSSKHKKTAFQVENKLRLEKLWFVIIQSWTASNADKRA